MNKGNSVRLKIKKWEDDRRLLRGMLQKSKFLKPEEIQKIRDLIAELDRKINGRKSNWQSNDVLAHNKKK